MTKRNFMPSVVLGIICLVAALLLALVNTVTSPIIEAAQDAAANEALLVVLPEGKNFEKITLDNTYPPIVQEGYRADGGFVFRMSVTGKSSGLVIMCGISSEGRVVGTKVIATQETDSYAAKVFPDVEGLEGKYKDAELSSFEPYLVAGATLTSKAYGEAIKAALQSFTLANGGEVDIRTPEQILQDNCNATLGTFDVLFTKWFATESLDGVDAVYESAAGRVYVFGETFVGIKADGTVAAADADAALVAKASAADEIIKASTLTELTARPDGVHENITKVSVTASGNYVFEASADGFSIYQYKEYYHTGSNTPIKLMVSVTAEGKILDCLTLSHDETKGYGDKCATEEYYESLRGSSKEEVTDRGAIAGATHTAEGYTAALKEIFDAFEIYNGGDQT